MVGTEIETQFPSYRKRRNESFSVDAMPRLNLPRGNTTLSLLYAHTNAHIVADMLTFPDRHLSLSLCGCKGFSLQPSLLRNNKHAHSCMHMLHITPSRCHKSSREASQQGRISLGENRGQGEKNQHCPRNMSPLHHCCTNTGLQSLYDRTKSQCFQLLLRMCY